MTTIAEALAFGWSRQQAGDLVGAESVYRQVLAAVPQNADAWCYLGIVLYDRRQFAASVDAYREAVRIRPQFPIAWSNMGNSLSALEQFAEAEASIRTALEQQPDYATAWINLGALQVKLGQVSEAADSFSQALDLAPDSEPAHRNLGAALVRQGKFAEGQKHSEAALQLNPHSAEAHRNRAIVWLLNGDWERGWQEFEWRWHCPEQSLPVSPRPLYAGEPLAGKTLLLHAEQGLGDTIHFIRYARVAQEQGARVIVETQQPLVPLLQSYPHVDLLIPRETPWPDFDYLLPMMSAPRFFGTRPENVPAQVPYLTARTELVERWRDKLPAGRPRIGIVWQGSRSHPADRLRSLPLEALAPLAQSGASLISLQKGEGRDQLANCSFAGQLVDFGEELDAAGPFLDTAALMTLVDLVVAVDTSLAHLAGALGVPVWVALHDVPDWRWLLHRSDTPWYPTMRLFRATEAGQWQPVIAQMAAELPGLQLKD